MRLLTKIRRLILFFMFALIISGVTAFSVETELHWLLQHSSSIPLPLLNWLQACYDAITATNLKFPMLAYGYDWLAFAHIVIATAFIGPLKDPVKNIWIINWAIIACFGVFPLAFIAGPIRHIPMFHILIDCSFGVLALIPLLICKKWIRQLKKQRGY